jgi:hypothetical protein
MLRVRGLLVTRMPAGCESESRTGSPAMVPSQIRVLLPGRASCCSRRGALALHVRVNLRRPRGPSSRPGPERAVDVAAGPSRAAARAAKVPLY